VISVTAIFCILLYVITRDVFANGLKGKKERTMRKHIRINEMMKEAWQLYEQGKWRAALRVYNHALRLEPRDERLYYARGLLFFKLNVYLRAIEDLTSVLAINPGYLPGQVHELRGDTYFELGDYKNTISDLTRAIETEPDSLDAHLKRGISYMKMGRHKEAIVDFEILLRYSQYEDFASVALGDSYAQLGEYRRAIEHYSKLPDLNLSCAWIYLKRATAYQESGNLHTAMNDYMRLVDLYSGLIEDNPRQGWLYSTRGFVLDRMGRHRDAMEDRRRAERLPLQNIQLQKATVEKQAH
jgi:tetratricopeptide (TPR) repeat protein